MLLIDIEVRDSLPMLVDLPSYTMPVPVTLVLLPSTSPKVGDDRHPSLPFLPSLPPFHSRPPFCGCTGSSINATTGQFTLLHLWA